MGFLINENLGQDSDKCKKNKNKKKNPEKKKYPKTWQLWNKLYNAENIHKNYFIT